MALLDLQGMELPEERHGKSGGSKASKGCGNVINTGGGNGPSRVSLLLC